MPGDARRPVGGRAGRARARTSDAPSLTVDRVESFPRQAALTGAFRHGLPRSFRIVDDGVLFLQSEGGRDPVLSLWHWSRDSGQLVRVLAGDVDGELSAAELAHRERVRESATGITAFDTAAGRIVADVGGRITQWDLAGGPRPVAEAAGGFDPRLSPDGRWISWVADGALLVKAWEGGAPRVLADDPDPAITWGVADFIAAEELDRTRGYWWLPDATGLIVQRTDESGVDLWHHLDLSDPSRPPRPQRYPAAGSANAEVHLWRVPLDGRPQRLGLGEFEYLATASPTLISTLDRSQETLTVRTGAGEVLAAMRQRPWIDLCPGLPAVNRAGQLLLWEDGTHRRLTVDEHPVSPEDAQLRSVVAVVDDGVYVTLSPRPSEVRVAFVPWSGECHYLTPPDAVASAVVAKGLMVISQTDWRGPTTTTVRDRAGTVLTTLPDRSEAPMVTPEPMLLSDGPGVQIAVLFPRDREDRLPIVMAPYGGPHAQRVVAGRNAYLSAQHLADQGFCVVIADGRGTPGQNPAWEHAIAGDLAGAALDDQVAAVSEVVARFGDRVDASRVGIMGWSFGGYLAALAVLRRPDVFAAAIAGAPVTEWRMYDTAYTERYLGDPTADAAPYDTSSLLPLADRLERPLLLIHGLADDNVFPAHTFRLSQALFEAGRAHEVLPLAGVTHMAARPDVAENLLRWQVDFLRRTLS